MAILERSSLEGLWGWGGGGDPVPTGPWAAHSFLGALVSSPAIGRLRDVSNHYGSLAPREGGRPLENCKVPARPVKVKSSWSSSAARRPRGLCRANSTRPRGHLSRSVPGSTGQLPSPASHRGFCSFPSRRSSRSAGHRGVLPHVCTRHLRPRALARAAWPDRGGEG